MEMSTSLADSFWFWFLRLPISYCTLPSRFSLQIVCVLYFLKRLHKMHNKKYKETEPLNQLPTNIIFMDIHFFEVSVVA